MMIKHWLHLSESLQTVQLYTDKQIHTYIHTYIDRQAIDRRIDRKI